LSLDFKAFYREYCTLIDTGAGMALSLRDVARDSSPGEKLGNFRSFDCVFWGAEGCAVYADRPIQCRTYPFWASVVDSEASWREESRSCPGIGAGELRSRFYIEERLQERRGAGMIVLAYGVDPENADEDTILGGARLGPDSSDALEGQK
jgi:hypothetical protein